MGGGAVLVTFEVEGDAAKEILQERYEDFVVFRSWDSWSPWFLDVAWDVTGMVIDLANKTVTLLAVTDTDQAGRQVHARRC